MIIRARCLVEGVGLLACVYANTGGVPAFDGDRVKEARRGLAAYCERDLAGATNRDSMILATQEERLIARKRGEDESWPSVNLAWDPLIVATKYAIDSLWISGDTALGLVSFREIAVSRLGAKFTRVGPRTSRVRITCRYVNDRWWIVQPPLPRVLPQHVLEALARQMTAFDADWYVQASSAQITTVQAYLSAITFLKRMEHGP